MLKVQDYLWEKLDLHVDPMLALESLKSEFGIKYKVYPEDKLVLLDYDQIESPKSHPYVIECRSLILSYPEFSVVSRKFDRFFNYGECPDYYADFSFEHATVNEKSDGSLIGIYYNPTTDRWEISTRGMAKAEGPHLLKGTFRQLVLDTLGVTETEFQQKMQNASRLTTYIFECIGPENRCVKKYDRAEMVLIGVSYVFSLYTQNPSIHHLNFFEDLGFNIRLPVMYDAKDIDSILKMVSDLKDLDEGVVVYDCYSKKRMKIKSATYVAAHKLRGNDPVPTRKNLLTVLLDGDIEELLAYFPEFKIYVEPLQKEIDDFLYSLAEVWSDVNQIENQKLYALAVKGHKGSGVLFEAKKKQKDPIHIFNQMDLNKKLRLFNV